MISPWIAYLAIGLGVLAYAATRPMLLELLVHEVADLTGFEGARLRVASAILILWSFVLLWPGAFVIWSEPPAPPPTGA